MVRQSPAQDGEVGRVSVDTCFSIQRLSHTRPPRFKGKKLSVDFGTLGKAFMPESPRGPSEKSGQSSVVPSVVVSRFVILRHTGHETVANFIIEILRTKKSY